jgi:hypothetical protein
MASRKKKDKKRKQKQRRRPGRAKLTPKLTQGLPENTEVISTPGGQEKMSEVLLEFVEPYLQHGRTEEAVNKLLTVALVAWNAALVTGSQRDKLIQDTLQAVPAEVRPVMKNIIEEMMRRKETHFANNRRMIINYQLTMTPSGPHLQVLSTFPMA